MIVGQSNSGLVSAGDGDRTYKEKIENAIQYAETQISRMASPEERANARRWKQIIKILRGM